METQRMAYESVERQVLHDLGFFGHYMHMHAGGRSGKQHVLVKLYRHGGHLTQRELQERFRISSAALSEVISKLEAEGYVTRTSSDADRRQRQIGLTPAGKARAVKLARQKEDFERRAFACLSAKELETLASLLGRMVEHWESFEERGKA